MSTEEETIPKPALSGVKGAAVTAAQMVMNPGAFLDWRGWFIGLYSSSVTAFTMALTTWLGSNGIEGAFPDVKWLHGIGMDWKTALGQCLIQAVLAAAKYVSQTKGLPPGVSASPFSLSKT